MKITIYNAQTGLKKEWEEEDLWVNAKQIFDEIPDISGCFLLIHKNQLGIKFQVINKDFFKSILIYRDEQKPVIINKEEGQKVLKLLLDDELEYVRLFDFPEKYFNNSSAKSQVNVSIAKADISPDSASKTLVFKTYKGKNYTKKEWENFEKEKFEEYARKNNIPLGEKEKPKKGGRFFLDEKESDF